MLLLKVKCIIKFFRGKNLIFFKNFSQKHDEFSIYGVAEAVSFYMIRMISTVAVSQS